MEIRPRQKKILEYQKDVELQVYNLYNRVLGQQFASVMQLDNPKWKTLRLEDICESIQPGFAEGKKNVKDGTIHLRMNNIGTNLN